MLSKLPRWVEVGGFWLAAIAGAVNAIGLLGFRHEAVSHVTGTSSLLSLAVARGESATALHLLLIVLAFLVGAIISGALTGNASLQLGRRYGAALVLEAALLAFAAVALSRGSDAGHLLASAACGLQNAMVSTYSGALVRTTHLTGLVTDIGTMLGARLRGQLLDRRRVLLYVILVCGFLAGGVAGALAYARVGANALLLPAFGALALAGAYDVVRRRQVPAALLVLVLVAGVGCAGESDSTPPVPTTSLFAWARRVDTLPGEYSRVVRAAEFHDSLLVFGDLREQLLWRVNLRTGARDTIGRRGGGPGEFARIGWVARVHADSIAVFNGSATRSFPVLHVATGRGRTLQLLDPGDQSGMDGTLRFMAAPYLSAGDTLGHVYGSPTLGPGTYDSASRRLTTQPLTMLRLLRYSIRGGAVDTLLTFPRGYVAPLSDRDDAGRWVTRIGLDAYAPVNGWSVRSDGVVLRADASTYTLALHNRDGDSTKALRIPFGPIAVSDSGWQAYLTSTRALYRTMFASQMNALSNTLGRSVAPPPESAIEEPEQPATLPALALDGGMKEMHVVGSHAWIPVHVGQNTSEPGWDHINLDTGARLGRYTLPPRHRLLLATAQGAYVIRVDDDDLEHLMLLRPPAP